MLQAGHRRWGGDHAETRLLDLAARRGVRSLRRAKLYVTLEPCSHFGKTPPCVLAVLDAGIREVHIAAADPDPRVAGSGIALLRAAGVKVVVGERAREALRANHAYHLRQRTGRSLVHLKLATSLDARLLRERSASGRAQGRDRWITGPEARAATHRARSESDLLVVGSGTVLADRPRLTVRDWQGPEPSRLVIDSALRTSPDGSVWRHWRNAVDLTASEPGGATARARPTGNFRRLKTSRGLRVERRPRLVVATLKRAAARRRAEFARLGWEIWEFSPDDAGRVPLAALFRRTAREGFDRCYVEAGPALAGALLRADRVDELSLFVAGEVFAGGGDWAKGLSPADARRVARFELERVEQVGSDAHLEWLREGWQERLAG